MVYHGLLSISIFNLNIYIYGCESKWKAPIHTLNPQADPYPRSIPKRRWSRPIHTSGSPRADPYPNFDATPYMYIMKSLDLDVCWWIWCSWAKEGLISAKRVWRMVGGRLSEAVCRGELRKGSTFSCPLQRPVLWWSDCRHLKFQRRMCCPLHYYWTCQTMPNFL